MFTLRDNDQIGSMAEKEEERALSQGWQDLDSCSRVGTCTGSVGAHRILCWSKLKNLPRTEEPGGLQFMGLQRWTQLTTSKRGV